LKTQKVFDVEIVPLALFPMKYFAVLLLVLLAMAAMARGACFW
jgi:hypothetical protein